MLTDPIVDEVRKIRDEHASSFGHDVKAICEDLILRQGASGRKLIKLPPKPATPPPTIHAR